MCGIAGFARNPKADAITAEFGRALLEELMERIELRGHDATGIAVIGGKDEFIFKVAETYSKVRKSKGWADAMARIGPDVEVVIGHTRQASHANAKRDDCAHPFVFGQVVGAHNGIIRNWVKIEEQLQPTQKYRVDSQAIFDLLDKKESPGEALMALEGWFALSWMKGRQLYFARRGAPLSMAYVQSLQMLVWASTPHALKGAMEKVGIPEQEYDMWNAEEGTIYQYDPLLFDAAGSHSVRLRNAFPKEDPQPLPKPRPAKTGRPYAGGRTFWDSTTATEVPVGGKKGKAKSGQITLREVLDQMEAMAGSLRMTRELLKDTRMRLAKLEDENESLWWTLDEHGIHPEWATEDTGFEDESDGPAKAPYKEEGEQEQDELPLAPAVCDVCQTDDVTKGPLLPVPGGGRIHEDCVFRSLSETSEYTD